MADLIEVASGLAFPEGPIAMPDGTVILVEMFGRRVTRVFPDGGKETIAKMRGGPNGAAIGPDGALYICNNGANFTESSCEGLAFPGPPLMDAYLGGSIQRVDFESGLITDLYTHVDGLPLWGPNDLVFDDQGGFYFTDHGISDGRNRKVTGIFYGKADGSSVKEVVFPVPEPNGIGLSPDGTMLYWAETWTGRIMQREIVGPGQVVQVGVMEASGCLYGFAGFQLLDSLAIDSHGNVCVATLVNGGVSVVSPAGELIDFVPTGDMLTTNICFGGDDLTTAYITLAGTGRLVKTTWPRPGTKLNYLNT